MARSILAKKANIIPVPGYSDVDAGLNPLPTQARVPGNPVPYNRNDFVYRPRYAPVYPFSRKPINLDPGFAEAAWHQYGAPLRTMGAAIKGLYGAPANTGGRYWGSVPGEIASSALDWATHAPDTISNLWHDPAGTFRNAFTSPHARAFGKNVFGIGGESVLGHNARGFMADAMADAVPGQGAMSHFWNGQKGLFPEMMRQSYGHIGQVLAR